MAHTFKIRRGKRADLPSLSCGEPALSIDTNEIFIGGSNDNIQMAKQKDLELSVKAVQDKILSVGVFYKAASGSANAYTASINDIESLSVGTTIEIRINITNTGSSTLNVNSLGNKNIVNADGTAISANTLIAGGIYGFVYNGTAWQLQSGGGMSPENPHFTGTMDMEGDIECTGTITADTVLGLSYNDYAERCVRVNNDPIEAGDILVGKGFGAVKSNKFMHKGVIGICSDSYGVLIGGNPDDKHPEQHEEKYIPCGMVGRICVKIVGKVMEHDLIVASDIAGVGIVCNNPDIGTVIGKALESSDIDAVKKVLVLLMIK